MVDDTEGDDPELRWRKGARPAEKLLTSIEVAIYITSHSLKRSGHFASETYVFVDP